MTAPTSPNGQSSNDMDDNLYEAIYPYEAINHSNLSSDVGEPIVVIKRDGDRWTRKISNRIGTFPYNYVQKIGNIQEKATAITSYQTNEEDHLSFEQDQIIYITKKE